MEAQREAAEAGAWAGSAGRERIKHQETSTRPLHTAGHGKGPRREKAEVGNWGVGEKEPSCRCLAV